ncbi:MAG: hypothetical protein JXA01_03130 [Dehalococcoidia bacterium]|nr:hypothetical protein [Dehalococcoidia bacterium]
MTFNQWVVGSIPTRPTTDITIGNPDFPCIGDLNLSSIRQLLAEEHVHIKCADTGGTYGRTIEFDLDTGEVIVTSRRLRETTSI